MNYVFEYVLLLKCDNTSNFSRPYKIAHDFMIIDYISKFNFKRLKYCCSHAIKFSVQNASNSSQVKFKKPILNLEISCEFLLSRLKKFNYL